MEIYFYTYEGLLEDKITIKSIGVWWYLSHKIYGKNNWYIFWVKISANTNHRFKPKLVLQVEQAT